MFLDKLFLGHFMLILCFSNIYAQSDSLCLDEFTIKGGSAEIISFSEAEDGFLSLIIITSENIAEGSVLYYIDWTDELSIPPYTYDTNGTTFDTALEYEEYVYDDYSLSTRLVNSMLGIVDYNNPERTCFLLLTLNFDFGNSTDNDTEAFFCSMEIRQQITDFNNEKPQFEFELYSVTLREDFPLLFTIPDFQLMAYDYDEGYPNDCFIVNMSEPCPLRPLSSSYCATTGDLVPVYFNLTQRLDYDRMNGIYQLNCTVTLEDFGLEPLSSSSVISVNVSPFPDEVPVFSQNLYLGDLYDPENETTVDLYTEIEAFDPDVPSTTITYTMTAADSDVGGDEYFSIDNSTAQIVVIKDLDDEFLSWKRVPFVLMACDEDNQCSKSILSINLPILNLGILEFEKAIYSVQLDSPSLGELVVQIMAVTSIQEEVWYSFVEDESPGLQFFEIDEKSGEITTTMNDTRIETFILTASATNGNVTDKTTVIIEVLLKIPSNVILKDSMASTTILEDTSRSVYTVSGTGATYYCILDVEPTSFEDYFWIANNGTINLNDTLDADDLQMGNLVTIKTGAYLTMLPCDTSSVTNYISNNEMLVELEIQDYDDMEPYFVDSRKLQVSEMVYAYPEDPALQKTIGPVAKIMTMDRDISQVPLTYSLSKLKSFSLNGFEIDLHSGEIYLTGKMNQTSFNVVAADSRHKSSLLTHIKTLTSNYISTMYFNGLHPNDIEDEITKISVKTRLNIYLLYFTITELTETGSKLEAQVYCTDKVDLINWEQLKDELNAESISDIEVAAFSDGKYYAPDEYENDDFKTSTIVLGVFTGLLVVLIIGFLIYTYMMNKKT